ncbi:uncharacterized protein LOC128718302 [Anopheles marshallii]|uniref:uncharacterized protein LOC128718302 n=1 Tax=Anopheles marshallii TaxID=1521116 RepID=UPI00237C405A|nr:uncharacterized protein LOC128718302 [Anopheles marshallii]
MPFSVVQTRGARGHGELSVVPDSWVQGTSSGKMYLFWPNSQDRVNTEILKNQKKITHRVGIIEAQLNTLLNYTDVGNAEAALVDKPLISNFEELSEFESSLSNEEYFQQISKAKKIEIVDKNVQNRLFALLDGIFDKNFLVKCSWTGISKTGTKIAMNSYKNILKLFKHVGSTNVIKVSDEMLKTFLMKRLKHAEERAKAKGIRKSSSRVRQPK